jgi:hypothetical protein
VDACIREFAARHRLPLRRHPDDGTEIIGGKWGHVYEYADGVLGVLFMPGSPRPHKWASLRRRLLAAGFTLIQNGDSEGAAAFDPGNDVQTQLAVKTLRIRHRRISSPAQLAAALRNLNAAKTRSIGPAEGRV